MIIGICGLIGAGKDTAADYLVNWHEFRRDSFAATLKDAVSAVFGWDRELLEGRTKAAREWREQIDTWWANRLDMPDLTPRWVLQYWGTDVFRNHFHQDIWIASLENKLRQTRDNVVISDCRFLNEVESIRRIGGRVIRIVRGQDPEWFHLARTSPQNMLDRYPGVHASEYSWAPTEFDHIVENNGTIDELYCELKNLV
jgi:hypothetical protein